MTVTDADAGEAVFDAVNVTTVLLPAAEAGLNAAVTPAGSPPALNATLATNPFSRVI